VLLDFGMSVRLSERQRLGYARLALAAFQLDLHSLQAWPMCETSSWREVTPGDARRREVTLDDAR